MINCSICCFPKEYPACLVERVHAVIGSFWSRIFNLFSEKVEPLYGINDLHTFSAENAGPYKTYLTGYGVNYPANNRPEAFTYKSDHAIVDDNVEVLAINGIGVNREWATKYARYVSDLVARKVTFIHNPDLGFCRNLLRYIKEAFANRVTPTALLMAQTMREKIGPEGMRKNIIVIAHSEGCAITKVALSLLTPVEREYVQIIAIAPGAYISEDDCVHVKHIVSPVDPVPYFDFLGRIQAIVNRTIKVIYPGKLFVNWILHPFFYHAYQDEIIDTFHEYRNNINLWTSSPAPT